MAINQDLEDTPELLKQNSYENWIVEIESADLGKMADLLISNA